MKDFFEFSKRRREQEKAANAKDFALGIGIGVLVGALAGILIAPKAGKETRQDIKETASQVATVARENVNKAVQATKSKAQEFSEEVNESAEKAKIKVAAAHKDISEGKTKSCRRY
ncbi:hypothetical protein AZF37_03510 [endosymbiont 'TC1' of Trimyema compressum]|uniref:YtxH domain-containing protein n=1 Tax=endosymbiont 'TC1' of Trimyema compressum TaxID=243899 RepID=UPI0007F16344|nr:YtxH domain-containing protein [endosymbiont 'TC1' of Trimyema compressum]AMP20362.1 hypothetical protein AZF37_03510 [endosymbiont 'TC1' of Trimyema compressum]